MLEQSDRTEAHEVVRKEVVGSDFPADQRAEHVFRKIDGHIERVVAANVLDVFYDAVAYDVAVTLLLLLPSATSR